MFERSSSDALGGRARGVIVGALIAFGWAVYGVLDLRTGTRYISFAVAASLTAGLLLSGFAMLLRARSLPGATPAQTLASKRVWRWFWLNLFGEIVLLNLATNLLAAPNLRVFWVPAISAVVGLHFWPMAYFFRVRSYWWVGVSMMVGGVVATLLIAHNGNFGSLVVHGEALANAVILWFALGMAAVAAR